MEITKGENANLAGMEPRCPKCGGRVAFSGVRQIFNEAITGRKFGVTIECQNRIVQGKECDFRVESWTPVDFAQFFRSPAPTPPLDRKMLEAVAEDGLLVTWDKDHKFSFSEVVRLMAKFAIEHIASPAPQLKVDEPCPTCERRYLGNMGLGEYSCVSCGMGLNEPCEHWKKMLSENEQLDKLAASPAQPEKRDECKCVGYLAGDRYATDTSPCSLHREVASQSGKEGQ